MTLATKVEASEIQRPAPSLLYKTMSRLLWPGLFIGGLIGAYFAFRTSLPLLWFNVVYLSVVLLISLAERLMPYEQTWLNRDDETFNDFAHTLLNKGGVQIVRENGTSAPMAVATRAQPIFSPPSFLWLYTLSLFVPLLL